MHSVSVWIGTESIFGLKPGYRLGKESKNKLDKFVFLTNQGGGAERGRNGLNMTLKMSFRADQYWGMFVQTTNLSNLFFYPFPPYIFHVQDSEQID